MVRSWPVWWLLLVLVGCGGESGPIESSPAPALKPTPTARSAPEPAAAQPGAHAKAELETEPDPIFSERITPPEPGVLRHVGRRFELRYPPAWHVVRVIDEGNVSYYVTPGEETHPRRMAVGLKINVSRIAATSQLRGKRPVDLMEHHLPTTCAQNPGLEPEGAVEPARLGSLEAARVELRGTLKPRRGRYRILFHMAAHADEQIYTSAFAPEEHFERYAADFERIVAESHFGRSAPPRRAESFEARHIVEKYKAATVSVVVMEEGRDRSTGTGFLVSDEGYLLTNWHVVVDMRTGKPHSHFRVEWDPAVGRKAEPAKLIGYKVQSGLVQAHHHTRAWGTDIALLKIAPGDYPSFPLTPLRDVQPGDGVVTLGFPSRGILQGLAITITRGVVTRFNRAPNGRIQSIFTDAAITHGSSGGPCVSLVTGGVIGLNTFGQPIERGASGRGPDLNDLVNYFGVVPIDTCLQEFPLVCDLGRDRDLSDLGYGDCFELSRLVAGAGAWRAATQLAEEAARREPASPDALWLQAWTRWQKLWQEADEKGKKVAAADVSQAIAAYEAALKRDPGHPPALQSLAYLCMDNGREDDAVRYADMAIREKPDRWGFHDMRAWASIRKGRYAEAVRHADRAKELCANTYPEPSITAGVAHYANKDYSAGHKAYENAAKVHPRNLRARIGVARYYEYRSQVNQALAEYERILEDFPDNAQVLARMGYAANAAQRLADACSYYDRAVRAYESGGERPPDWAFEGYLKALEKRKQNAAGLVKTAKYLGHVAGGPRAAWAHIQAQIFCRPLKLPGLADAHLRVALKVTKSATTRASLSKRTYGALSLDEIVTMVKAGYHSSVAIPLIVAAPLKFRASTEADVAALRKRGIPGDWILAILVASRKTPAPRTTPKPRTRTQPKPVRPHGIVGKWRATVRKGRISQVLTFEFTAQGRVTARVYESGRLKVVDTGRYTVSGIFVKVTDSRGKPGQWIYSLSRRGLTMTLAGYGMVTFTRQR
ncbi:MAG: trypsin-like peptidase domain-containing protein [Planctomycetota bacterium]|jgi:tetratricopeptide (TPR) repeat protein